MGCFAEERTVDRDTLDRELRREYQKAKGVYDPVTNLMDILFDSNQNDYDCEYCLVKYSETDETKWWQRVNCLWVCPLMVIHNAVSWFRTGHFEGVRKESKLGKILVKLVGA